LQRFLVVGNRFIHSAISEQGPPKL
jgi:hypothetical protein